MKYVLVDTDIFVRNIRYKGDVHREVNDEFVALMRKGTIKGATSIYNALEVLGILSFNLNFDQLQTLYKNFCADFKVKLLAKLSSQGEWIYSLEDVFKRICLKQSLGDALISTIVEEFSYQLSAFVSWNAKHFQNLSVPAMTPHEFLLAHKSKNRSKRKSLQ